MNSILDLCGKKKRYPRKSTQWKSMLRRTRKIFYNYELYFYLLCQHFQERDFTSSFYNSFYKQILIYSIYSELFYISGKSNTADIKDCGVFAFS